jgi:hypothetical protein
MDGRITGANSLSGLKLRVPGKPKRNANYDVLAPK